MGTLFSFIQLILVIAGIISVAGTSPMKGIAKFLWIVGMIVLPLLGPLAWFTFGKNSVRNKYGTQQVGYAEPQGVNYGYDNSYGYDSTFKTGQHYNGDGYYGGTTGYGYGSYQPHTHTPYTPGSGYQAPMTDAPGYDDPNPYRNNGYGTGY